MSDMSRPDPRSPAATDHERHDPLLVAQFVAGDPLKPEQQAEAHRLVTDCRACAALAAELPAVSRAVAQEPVPPRRRDFRLSPESAERLRGNAITRLLRGLSLPSSRAFQPAAAGVLSIGLLFVVAGYAWPDGGTVTVQAEPNAIDWGPSASSAAPLDIQPAPALGSDTAGEDDAALSGAERAMEDPEFADSLAQSQAGLAQESMQKSQLQEADVRASDADDAQAAAPDAARVEAYANGSETEVAELSAATDVSPEPAAADGGIALEQPVQDVAADAAGAFEASVDETARTAAATELTVAPDDGPADLLIVLGLALALGGSALLLLGWLARRARDPLAP